MKFNIITADCPWSYNARNNSKTRFGLGMHGYAGMKIEDICALPVQDIAEDNCALFLWVTCPKIEYMPLVMKSWGFRVVTKAFCYEKVDKKGNPRLLAGHYTGSCTEDCWLGIRGRMYDKVVDKGVNQVIRQQLTRQHSEKPNAEVRSRIVRLFGDLPRIELFSRVPERYADGWVNVGNDVDGLDIREALNLIKTGEYLPHAGTTDVNQNQVERERLDK